MILVDTSVWIDHLRRRTPGLARQLEQGQVACHPFVIGELALGSLKNRHEVLGLLAELPAARTVAHEEAMTLVDARGLSGSGLGWVDVHLLASSLVEGWPLWTVDRRLAAVAEGLGVAWTG